jgi:hypothetical protein
LQFKPSAHVPASLGLVHPIVPPWLSGTLQQISPAAQHWPAQHVVPGEHVVLHGGGRHTPLSQ